MSLLKITIIFSFVLLIQNWVEARVKIPVGEMEQLSKVYDLPNTEEWQLDNGNYLDLGTLYKEFNIATILPLWITEEPKLVGYDEQADEYYELPDENLNQILAMNNIIPEEVNKVPFYHRYGGKLVLIGFIALIVLTNLFSKDKEKKVESKVV